MSVLPPVNSGGHVAGKYGRGDGCRVTAFVFLSLPPLLPNDDVDGDDGGAAGFLLRWKGWGGGGGKKYSLLKVAAAAAAAAGPVAAGAVARSS